jgi:hypothetical protein
MTDNHNHPRQPDWALVATSRAARATANHRARHPSWADPIREARAEGIDAMEQLAMAAIAQCAELADKLHGERAQARLDLHALDVAAYVEQHRTGDGGPASSP